MQITGKLAQFAVGSEEKGKLVASKLAADGQQIALFNWTVDTNPRGGRAHTGGWVITPDGEERKCDLRYNKSEPRKLSRYGQGDYVWFEVKPEELAITYDRGEYGVAHAPATLTEAQIEKLQELEANFDEPNVEGNDIPLLEMPKHLYSGGWQIEGRPQPAYTEAQKLAWEADFKEKLQMMVDAGIGSNMNGAPDASNELLPYAETPPLDPEIPPLLDQLLGEDRDQTSKVSLQQQLGEIIAAQQEAESERMAAEIAAAEKAEMQSVVETLLKNQDYAAMNVEQAKQAFYTLKKAGMLPDAFSERVVELATGSAPSQAAEQLLNNIRKHDVEIALKQAEKLEKKGIWSEVPFSVDEAKEWGLAENFIARATAYNERRQGVLAAQFHQQISSLSEDEIETLTEEQVAAHWQQAQQLGVALPENVIFQAMLLGVSEEITDKMQAHVGMEGLYDGEVSNAQQHVQTQKIQSSYGAKR